MSEVMMNLCVCRAVAMDVSRSLIFMPASASYLASVCPQGRSLSLSSDPDDCMAANEAYS
jgi:hypothetical protein